MKLKDISFKIAYDHYEGESCQMRDADRLALAFQKALEEERERCAAVVDALANEYEAKGGHGIVLRAVGQKIRELQ